jgi:hypothetical protein
MSINSIKISSVIFLVLASIQAVYSQHTLSVSGKYENGETVNRGDFFMLNDHCNFYIQDEDGNKKELISCRWRFECLDKDSIYIVEKEITGGNIFDFLLDDLYVVNSHSLKQIKNENDNSVLFQARISCIGQTDSGENLDLSFPVFLNLLPSVPVINVVKFISISEKNDSLPFLVEPDDFFFYLELSMFSDRTDHYGCVVKEYDGPYTSTVSWDVPVSQNFSFETYYWSDTDRMVFIISAVNKFGFAAAESYTITKSDLATGLAKIEDEPEILLYPNPFSDAIYIKGEYGNIENLTITDINGRTVKVLSEVKTPTIQTDGLPSGIYIVTIKQKLHLKNKYYKLIKR